MRDRTADLFRAREALSQLSYSPKVSCISNHEACQVNTKCVLIEAWYPRRIACYASGATTKSNADLVGLGRFELPTSPLSGVRSNQLSYRPIDWSAPKTHRQAKGQSYARDLFASTEQMKTNV